MKILVTGINGFIGRNLAVALAQDKTYEVIPIHRQSSADDLRDGLAQANLIVHLAGVNRPQSPDEFRTGNLDFTAEMCRTLLAHGRSVPILFSSSRQAEQENPYGVSKRMAEDALADYARQSGAPVLLYRLTNVFGKWSRPHYNSVVSTFCHAIARDEPISISDPDRELSLVHVDDVVRTLLADIADLPAGGVHWRDAAPQHQITLGRLAELIRSFRASRQNLIVPDFADPFAHTLYSVYLSYLPTDEFAYNLRQHKDARGSLAEFIKSPNVGQIFVSRTVPGITRGNHFHHVKTEKFLVLEGEAVIRFRKIGGSEVLEYPVRGEEYRVVDIPPGYTHSIENVGQGELVTLFWASELFNPEKPDTIYEQV